LSPNEIAMKLKLACLFTLVFIMFSCKNDNEKRQKETLREAKKKELIFANINKYWVFNGNPINETSRSTTLTWAEWRLFLAELNQKPKKTIGAFQKKSTEISKKAMALNINIPVEFNIPPIKSRIAALITKVKMLDLYIHLTEIPDQKVIALVPEINAELVALQNQMEKVVLKSKIPIEEGESELLKMLDSARAIPNIPVNANLPRVE
jgi:hypothetical protein